MAISTIGQNGLNAPLSLTSPSLGTPSSLVLTNATGLPQAGLGTNVVGNGPAVSAYPSSNQTITTNVFTKILFQTEEFDTNSNFASSTFTPTVAGFYQVQVAVGQSTSTTGTQPAIYKNGTIYKRVVCRATDSSAEVVALVYCNGSTDYIEGYGLLSGTTPATTSSSDITFFQACLVRSA